jgi:carbohydrate-selective porin OprB
MTGQPYELFTFTSNRIVPVHLSFLHRNGLFGGLAGGGAAFHGQGLSCSHRRGQLVITQLYWDGPAGNAPMVHVKGGGMTPAGADTVDAFREQWTLTGQPLTERSVRVLPVTHMTYRTANAAENAHCSG